MAEAPQDVETAPPADEPDLAGWDVRAGAWLLDLLIVWGSLLVLAVVIALAAGVDATAMGYVVGFAGRFLVSPLYFATFHAGGRGQTLGKRAAGIRVRPEEKLAPLGFGRALGRSYITALFWVVLYVPGLVDGLWALWDKRRQTWHDKVARTFVVRAGSPAAP